MRALLVTCCLWFAIESQAVTVLIQPGGSTSNSGDSYLPSALPNNNFGPAGALSVAGTGTANGAIASMLKFDLAAAKSAFDTAFGPGAWTLVSIAIQLNAVSPNNANFNALHAGLVAVDWVLDDSWTESGITWNGLPALLSSGTQSLGSFSYAGGLGISQYNLTSSAGLLNDLLAGNTASFHLSAGDSAVSIVMNSRNFTTAENRPALVLTAAAIPEPGRSMLLLLSAATFLLQRRRRFTESTRHASCG